MTEVLTGRIETPASRVFVVGSAHLDLTLRVATLPIEGETVTAKALHRGFGGKGANQAVSAGRAGASVVFAGVIGRDLGGDAVRENLSARGIDVALMDRDRERPTATAVVIVDGSGRNQIVVDGSAARLQAANLERALREVAKGDVVVLPCEAPAPVIESTIALARSRGATVILNLAPFTTLRREVLAACDLVVMNEVEAQSLVKRVRDDLIDLASSCATAAQTAVIVTAGARGSVYATPASSTPVVVGAVAPQRVADTTGAGDCYVGSLAARLAAGDDVAEAMAFASIAASVSVGWLGAQPPIE